MRFGPYVLVEKLGEGATGDVHLAVPAPTLGVPSPVVVKRLWAELSTQERMIERFLHEAELAIAVSHPNVARVYDVGRVGDTYYIAGELVPGWSALDLFERAQAARAVPPIGAVVSIGLDWLAGLSAIHGAVHPNGLRLEIIHRDLSARNLMIDEDGRGRVIDLGLGKSAVQRWRTQTGVVMGSPGYMSPEQALGHPVDRRSDLYSVAVVLFELLTLVPYIPRGPALGMVLANAQAEARSLRATRADVPEAVDRAVAWALARRPEDRVPTAAKLAAALAAAARIEPAADLIARLFGEDIEARRRRRREAIEAVDVESEATEVTTRLVTRPSVEPAVALAATRTEGASLGSLHPRRSRVPWIAAPWLVLAGLASLAVLLVRPPPADPIPLAEPVSTPSATAVARPPPPPVPLEPPPPDRSAPKPARTIARSTAPPPPDQAAREPAPRELAPAHGDERTRLMTRAKAMLDEIQRRAAEGEAMEDLEFRVRGATHLNSIDDMRREIERAEQDLGRQGQ
jgi:serine/threonine-protein kinase